MATAADGSGRPRGHIRRPGRSFQVLVYAGVDPVTGKPHRLTASTTDEKEAHRILRRFVHQLDEQTHARTNASFGDALDAWLRVHEVDANTAADYEATARLYIKPALGNVPLSRITAQSLEQFYADLRRCRVRCDGQPFVEHRAVGEHECRMIRHRRPPGRPPAKGYPAHDCDRAGCTVIECPTHVCRPLTPARIRKIHFTVSAVLSAAVRWEWIKSNPADVARKPRQMPAQPDPPSTKEAARIVAAAWDQDDDWGTLVWLTMVTGMRRGELLALRWEDVDLDTGMLEIRRNYVWVRGQGIEKDTKTHQMRRIALDLETVEILHAHRERYDADAAKLGVKPNDESFVFSYEPTHDRPCNPHGVSHRYAEMCAAVGIDSHLHALRHYSATELLTAGVDLRTVAGRLGHGGWGRHDSARLRRLGERLRSSSRRDPWRAREAPRATTYTRDAGGYVTRTTRAPYLDDPGLCRVATEEVHDQTASDSDRLRLPRKLHPEWQLFAARLVGDGQIANNDVHAGAVGYRNDATPNPVLARDARTLIGMLAYLEGALLDGSVTEDWAQKLRTRFIREGLLPSDSTDRDVRQVINDVNQRLRYAIGEYPNPPASVRVP